MAGFLSIGAGANEGLQEYLAQQLKEKLYEEGLARDAETHRSNVATEDYRSKALEETTAQRKQSAADLALSRQNEQADKVRDDLRTAEQLRPIGSSVDPAERRDAVNIGLMPSSLYTEKGGTLNQQTGNPDDQGPTLDLSYAGTEAQQLARLKEANGGGTPSFATPNFTLKGKPIVGVRDNHTGRVMYQGQDVTDFVQPYVPPDRVIMQTDTGLVPRPQVAGAAGRGAPMQPPLTSATRTMKEGAQMLQPHIDILAEQAKTLDEANLFGPAMSRIRHLAERVGSLPDLENAIASDPELNKNRAVGQFSTRLGLLATGAGRVHGGARGGGSPLMLEHFKALLNDSSNLDMFLGRLDALDEYMSGYAAGPGGTTGGGAAKPTGTDPYQDYLNRKK